MLTEQLNIFDNPLNPDSVLVVHSSPPKPQQDTTGAANAALAGRFEEMADKLQAQISDKLSHDRQTNTPKRMAQAMSARVDGERLARTQQALRVLARLHRSGDCPALFGKLKSKKAIHDLMGAELEPVRNGFHTYYHDTGKPRADASPAAVALWAFLDGKSEADEQADRLAQMIRDLQFSKIPGYFPTPDAVIDTMLDYAQIDGKMSVLEPSAGAGAILDRLPEKCVPVVYEINPALTGILEAKKHFVHKGDFLEAKRYPYQFDRVLMNPPFEKLQDVDHVLKAFDWLKSGGRLVAIMSPAAFFRDTKKCQKFRTWFEELGGEMIELPEQSFKQSGTGVSSRLIIVDKP